MVIDTDGGIDDLVALDWVLSFHGKRTSEDAKTIRVRAVTVTGGNVEVEKAVRNCKLAVARRGLASEIRVYQGACRPLVGRLELPAWRGHGDDGLGGSESLLPFLLQRYPECKSKDDTAILLNRDAPASTAVQALLELAEEYGSRGGIDVIALGPLTNVAIALLMGGEQFSKGVGQFVWMGGCSYAEGNASTTAEYNAFTDPEAARVCFERLPRIEMVSWELTRKTLLPWSWMDERGLSTAVVQFKELEQAMRSDATQLTLSTAQFFSFLMYSYESLYRTKDVHPGDGFVLCDTVAAAVWLFPSLRTKIEDQTANVETAGSFTRGTIAIDWYGKGLLGTDLKDNLRHVLEIDIDRFNVLLSEYLSS